MMKARLPMPAVIAIRKKFIIQNKKQIIFKKLQMKEIKENK